MFNKYSVKNDAYSQLLVGISAGATTIELKVGEGTRFPASNFIATLVQYDTSGDPSSAVVKKEKINVTSRSGDTLTVVRGLDTPTSFDADDFIYLNVTAEVIEDIQNEVERIVDEDIAGLESSKLDANGQLRTGNGAWKTSYNNASGNEVELALGASGRVLQSNGTSSAPTWEVPTVDINGLTEKTTPLSDNDELIIYDGSGNKKIKWSNAIESPVLYRKTTQSVASTSSSISQDITIPANSMGANGILRIKIDAYIDITSSTGTLTVTFGGTTVFSQATSTDSAILGEIIVFNVNNTSLQNKGGQVLMPGLSPTDIYQVNTTGASFATVDTTSNVTLNITLSGANSNKYLNFVSVELI